MVGFSPTRRFSPGRLVATPAALEAFEAAREEPLKFLCRHECGDWGELPREDKLANDEAVRSGGRILSAFILQTGVKVWCITERDRAVTTFLLPEEY
jgi:hypothetical protein